MPKQQPETMSQLYDHRVSLSFVKGEVRVDYVNSSLTPCFSLFQLTDTTLTRLACFRVTCNNITFPVFLHLLSLPLFLFPVRIFLS